MQGRRGIYIKQIKVQIKDFKYDILLGENINLKEVLNPFISRRLFIITDKNLYHYYKSYLNNHLNDFNFIFVVVEPSEHSKSFESYESVINTLLQHHISRNDLIVAFGGGVVGDLAGFVSATILRGVDLIQIPTSLLAMVDSSIGGKTGIDTTYGKNLVGAFKQPILVVTDTHFLKTLPKVEFINGLAEVLKAGLIRDKALLELLKQDHYDVVEMIYKAIMVKKEIVELDPFESHERMFLNFGHTFGHSIEQAHHYEIKHGFCVAMGMDLALQLGIHLKETNPNLLTEYYQLSDKIGLPRFEGNKTNYIEQIKYDKKHKNGKIYFVLLKEVGQPIICPISEESLYDLSN